MKKLLLTLAVFLCLPVYAMTAAQLLTVRNDIAANGDLNSWVNNGDGNFEIARLYNAPAVPSFPVWRTNCAVNDIFDAIAFDKYTPTDAADGTATWTNRALAIQVKQMNLQVMLQGRDTINASKPNVRLGLRDAVIQIPSGVGGALVTSAGSSATTLLTACTRPGTRLEKLFTTGTQTTGTTAADVMGFEGVITNSDVNQARAN